MSDQPESRPSRDDAPYERPVVEDVEVKAGLVTTVPGVSRGTPPPAFSAPRKL